MRTSDIRRLRVFAYVLPAVVLLILATQTLGTQARADGTLPPSAPHLEGHRTDLTHDEITWSASSYQGNLTSYHVQRETPTGAWTDTMIVPPDVLQATLTNPSDLSAPGLRVCPETSAWGVGPEPGFLQGYGCSNTVNPLDGYST